MTYVHTKTAMLQIPWRLTVEYSEFLERDEWEWRLWTTIDGKRPLSLSNPAYDIGRGTVVAETIRDAWYAARTEANEVLTRMKGFQSEVAA